MSMFFGIVLLIASGWVVLERLKVKLPVIEMGAYALLTGIGLQSIWMLLCDLLNVQFSQAILSVFNLALIVLLSDLNAIRSFDYGNYASELGQKIKAQVLQPDLGSWIIWGVLGGLLYLISVKGLYWPTSEHDAIGSFDKLGMWYALEGKLHISMYKVGLQGTGGVYPPLFPASIAFSYLYGGDNPKIISLLFYIATLLIFFYALCRYISPLGAAAFTLVLAWSPEYYSHAALLLSNLPSAAYVGAASLSLFLWLQHKEQSYFTLCCIMMGLALWVRQDLIPFAVAGGLVMLWYAFKQKGWKQLLIYGAAVATPIIIWSLYAKLVLQLSTAERFGEGSFITVAKLQMVAAYLWAYLGIGQQGDSAPGYFLYGIAFLLPVVIALVNYKYLVKDGWVVPTYIVVALALYALIFLLIDEKLQNAPLQSLMESSFKRGLFCFMPAALFYAATTTVSVKLFDFIEVYRKG